MRNLHLCMVCACVCVEYIDTILTYTKIYMKKKNVFFYKIQTNNTHTYMRAKKTQKRTFILSLERRGDDESFFLVCVCARFA